MSKAAKITVSVVIGLLVLGAIAYYFAWYLSEGFRGHNFDDNYYVNESGDLIHGPTSTVQ